MTARIEEIQNELADAIERLAWTVADEKRGEEIAEIQRLQGALVAALRRTHREARK